MKRSITAIILSLLCFILTVPLSQAATIYLENGSDECQRRPENVFYSAV